MATNVEARMPNVERSTKSEQPKHDVTIVEDLIIRDFFELRHSDFVIALL
jgi:hypothetical protein